MSLMLLLSFVVLAICALAAYFGDNDQGMVRAENVRVVKEPKFHPVVDAHVHIDNDAKSFETAVRVMDACGIAAVVNLSGTSGKTLDKAISLASKYPGRFVTFCDGRPGELDWKTRDIGETIAGLIRDAHTRGAAGIGEIVKWALHGVINWDDPRLEPMWGALEELQMPINWHVADPTRYWMPETPKSMLEAGCYLGKHPLKHTLIMQQERVLEKFPKMVVIASHANWLNDQIPHLIYRLETYPNYHFDLSAACDEFGKLPIEFEDLCLRYSDRIFFGTDAGFRKDTVTKHGGAAATLADYKAFFTAHFLFLGTDQKMIPCAWKGAVGRHFVGYENGFVRFANDGVNLPEPVLKNIYYRNAERMFGIKVAGWRPAKGFTYAIPKVKARKA